MIRTHIRFQFTSKKSKEQIQSQKRPFFKVLIIEICLCNLYCQIWRLN